MARAHPTAPCVPLPAHALTRARSCALAHLAIGLAGLAQVLDGPHDREQDGAAADDVHQMEDVAPREPVNDRGALFLRDHDGDVGKDCVHRGRGAAASR